MTIGAVLMAACWELLGKWKGMVVEMQGISVKMVTNHFDGDEVVTLMWRDCDNVFHVKCFAAAYNPVYRRTCSAFDNAIHFLGAIAW